ncbi:carboxypeptidase-like regulatory domain-containing protein [Aquimarina sp. AU474]|uniref:carboxypeptidase-like regulatory domain-containing protein n=1 Tax=Aquimarina sp. AU474 TaxID=2108529 RepID=UPI000D69C2D1|nr:carboxypeptidase-like regulatory domain-containing protein [Aquimarina sp. AU474]
MRFKITYSILFFFCIFSAFGQRTINGRIIDQFSEIAIGISIFDKDTIEIGKSDFNGYFKIKLPQENNKLIFAGVGYEWATITVPKECENIETILFLASTYDFMSPKKVDRLRKKEFEKLSELHSQAFQKGLFKTEKTCVSRKFEPDFPELDEIRQQHKLTKKKIKTKFKELKIGDIIKVPTQTWSAYTNGTDFGCLITGMVIGKNKKKGGYNLIIKVTDNLSKKDKATYNGNPVKIGDSITHNMKYYKIITE